MHLWWHFIYWYDFLVHSHRLSRTPDASLSNSLKNLPRQDFLTSKHKVNFNNIKVMIKNLPEVRLP